MDMANLKADNFLLVFEDESVIRQYVTRQRQSEPPRELGDYAVYASRGDFGPLQEATGRLKISDFGSAVMSSPSKLHFHDIEPEGLEAPEVLFRAGWTCSAEIWNLDVVLWELLQDEPLSLGRNPGSGTYCRNTHVAQLHKLLSPPPEALLLRADEEVRRTYYTPDGQFKYPELIPPDTFEWDNLPHISTVDDKGAFLQFSLKMLRWIPEDRATAEELYHNPWLVA